MTPEDQDAVIGRLVRERRDLRGKIAALETEAHSIGATLTYLGQLLRDSPDSIMFENHPAPAELIGRAQAIKQADINAPRIMKLIDDLRETRRALAEIERKGRQFDI